MTDKPQAPQGSDAPFDADDPLTTPADDDAATDAPSTDDDSADDGDGSAE